MIRTRLAVLIVLLVALSEALGFVVAWPSREGVRANGRPTTIAPRDKPIVDQYMATHVVRKLQVGAGPNNLPDWLNTDIEPRAGQVYLDATQPLPFPDGSFRYVYAEQLIEHLTFPQGLGFMKECHRILAPGGRIRLATPNLLSIVHLFDAEKAPIQRQFMDYEINYYGLSRIPTPEATTLNLMVRTWGHQFLYDPKTLRAGLEAAGFAVTEYTEEKSDDPALQNIEMHWKLGGHEIDQYTSQYVEGLRS